MAAHKLSRSRRIGFLEQTQFAAEYDATGAYETFYVDAGSIRINPDVQVSGFDLTSSSSLFPERARRISDVLSGLPRISWSMPMDRFNCAQFWASAMHNVVETGSTPFQKVITCLAETGVPDFTTITAKEPHLITIATDNVSAVDGILLHSALIDMIELDIDFNARGIARYAKLMCEAVGHTMSDSLDLTGTWTTPTSAYYNASTAFTINIAGAATINGAAVKRYRCVYNNNVTSDVKTTGGAANNYLIKPTVQVTLTLPYTTTTAPLFAELADGDEATITLTTGSTGQAGFFEQITKGRIINNDLLGDSNDYQELNLTIEGEVPSSGNIFKTTIADAKDRDWPAS